ncbi:hypothetical protein VPH35_088951 [Triticum aestivum]
MTRLMVKGCACGDSMIPRSTHAREADDRDAALADRELVGGTPPGRRRGRGRATTGGWIHWLASTNGLLALPSGGRAWDKFVALGPCRCIQRVAAVADANSTLG